MVEGLAAVQLEDAHANITDYNCSTRTIPS